MNQESTTRHRIPTPRPVRAWLAYTGALLIPGVMFLVAHLSRPFSELAPFGIFTIAILVTAWLAGLGPAIVSLVAAVAGGWLLMATSSIPDHAEGAFTAAFLFAPVGLAIAALTSLARSAVIEREEVVRNLRETEHSLKEAIRARDAFISVAGHELRTPLTSVQLRLAHVERKIGGSSLTGDEDLRRTIAVLHRQIQRLGFLVNNVLDLSVLGMGRLRLEPHEMDLSELARDVAEQCSHQLDASGSKLEIDADEPVLGRWDRARLKQVLLNLLSNAARFGEGRPIRLSIDLVGGQARIQVEDQGIGIDEKDQQRVFERFERAAGTGSGLGIGLWVVRQLVGAHHGSIRLESQPGKGSTFCILLPLHSVRAELLTPSPSVVLHVPPDLQTGDAEIDAQHALIIAEADRVRSASPNTIWTSLAALSQHVTTHFDYEEEIMDRTGYPDRASHVREHLSFFETYFEQRNRLEREGATPENVAAFADVLQEWVRHHVLVEDRRMAAFVRSNRPAAAPPPSDQTAST